MAGFTDLQTFLLLDCFIYMKIYFIKGTHWSLLSLSLSHIVITLLVKRRSMYDIKPY